MKVLFIGGSGNISTSVSRIAIARGMELTLLNRGKTTADIPGARWLTADFHDLADRRKMCWGMRPSMWWWIGLPIPSRISNAI